METQDNEGLIAALEQDLRDIIDRYGADAVENMLSELTVNRGVSESHGLNERQVLEGELSKLLHQKWLGGAGELPIIKQGELSEDDWKKKIEQDVNEWEDNRNNRITELCNKLGVFVPKNRLEASLLTYAGNTKFEPLINVYNEYPHLRPGNQATIRRSNGALEIWTIHELLENGDVELWDTENKLRKAVPLEELMNLNPKTL